LRRRMLDLDRLHLYYFLLPFTAVSLLLYAQILIEIYRKRKTNTYDSFFYRMICSQAIYDISHPIMYFLVEIPQGWSDLYPFLTGMNGSILPQLIYAHVYLCSLAQTAGITVMSISRMLIVCHPHCRIT
ncbi:hypothetical protein PFISCL1PPCAC_13520, partial [Pristionchus fissidentatus]